VSTIFRNVGRLACLKLKYFTWQYFQGGLGFNHKEPCPHCRELGNLTHEHIFNRCACGGDIRRQANNLWAAIGDRPSELLFLIEGRPDSKSKAENERQAESGEEVAQITCKKKKLVNSLNWTEGMDSFFLTN
jgi:hypothetical protein